MYARVDCSLATYLVKPTEGKNDTVGGAVGGAAGGAVRGAVGGAVGGANGTSGRPSASCERRRLAGEVVGSIWRRVEGGANWRHGGGGIWRTDSLEEWGGLFKCWWAGLALSARTELRHCLGALAHQLGGRVHAAWRALSRSHVAALQSSALRSSALRSSALRSSALRSSAPQSSATAAEPQGGGLELTHHRDSNPRPLTFWLEPGTSIPEPRCVWLETHATELSLPELNLVDEHLEAPVVPGHVAGEGGSNAGKRARAPVVGQLLGGGAIGAAIAVTCMWALWPTHVKLSARHRV